MNKQKNRPNHIIIGGILIPILCALTIASCKTETSSDIPDVFPPLVASTNIANGEIDVALNSDFEITMVEDVAASTISSSSAYMKKSSDGAIVLATVSYSASDRKVTISPNSNLTECTFYNVTLADDVTDTQGNRMTARSFTFDTLRPPTVSSTSPDSGDSNIATSSDITITFSESMDSSTLNTATISVFDEASNTVSGTVTASGRTATFNPNYSLSEETTYTVTISTDVEDLANINLEETHTFTFRTVDNNAPSVSSTSPDSEQTVGSISSIMVNFSEAMDNSTITTSSFTLIDPDTGDKFNGTVSYEDTASDTHVATFTLSSNNSLSSNNWYEAVLSTAMTDTTGNALASEHSWYFAIGAGATDVSAAYRNTCAILEDATVVCWGAANYTGAVLGSQSTDANEPVEISGLEDVIDIAVGDEFACAVISGGTVKCWGQGDYNQMGNGFTSDQTTPATVPGISTAAKVVAGAYHACALLSSGSVSCWGYGTDGQMGDGATDNNSVPNLVSSLTGIVGIAAGKNHNCAVNSSGNVYCWGDDNRYQLGDDSTSTDQSTPVQVSGISTATDVAAGAYHSCALLSDDTVKCWGYNNYRQGGAIGTSAGFQYDFEDNSFPGDFTTSGSASWSVVSSTAANGTSYSLKSGVISHGQSSCFEFTSSTSTLSFYYSVSSESNWDYLKFYEDGTQVDAWSGSVGWTQYNHSTTSGSHTFKWCYTKDGSISSGSDTAWVDEVVAGVFNVVYTPNDTVDGVDSATAIVAGDYYSCALLENSNAKCWGYGADYRMGDASTDNNDEAGAVSDLSNVTVLSTTGDSSHTCAVTSSAEVKCWGQGDYGKQGDADTADNTTATAVPGVLQEPSGHPLSGDYDFENGSFPSEFTSSGNASWFVTSTTAANGTTYSIKSGSVSDNQSSCFEFTETASSSISFYYNVSSESNWDYLRFYEDGTQVAAWSGSVGWTQYNHSTTSGSHTFKWCYTKDGSASTGSDAAWIDEIEIE